MTSLRQQIRRWVEHFLRRDRERLPSSEPGLADQQLADSLLAHAVSLDDNRPADDISVVVLKVSPRTGDDVRRMSVRLPFNG